MAKTLQLPFSPVFSSLLQFAGLQCNVAPNQSDGTMLLDDIRQRIRDLDDIHQPVTKMICLENTHNKCGGRVLPLDYLAQVSTWNTSIVFFLLRSFDSVGVW